MLSYNSVVVDDLIKSINTLLRVRVRMSSMLSGSQIKRSSFLKNNSEAKKWRSINEDIAKNRSTVTSRVSELYNANANDKIWVRAAARINESMKMVLGKQAGSLNKQSFGDTSELDKVVSSLVDKNMQLIRSFFKSIYCLQLQRKTLVRKSVIRKSSRLSVEQCRDLLKMLEALVQSNKQVMVNKANLVEIVSKLDDLNMQYDISLEDNLKNLSDNMFARNKSIKATINQYAYNYWCRRKFHQQNSRADSSKSISSVFSNEQPSKHLDSHNQLIEKGLSLLEELSELKDEQELEKQELVQTDHPSKFLEFQLQRITSSESSESFEDQAEFVYPVERVSSPYLRGRYQNEATARRRPQIKKTDNVHVDLFVKNLTLGQSGPIKTDQSKNTSTALQNRKLIKSSKSTKKLKSLNRNIVQSSLSAKRIISGSKDSARLSLVCPPPEQRHLLWDNTQGYIRKSSTGNAKRLMPYRFQRKQQFSHDERELENLCIVLADKSNVHLKMKQITMVQRQNYMDFTKDKEMKVDLCPK